MKKNRKGFLFRFSPLRAYVLMAFLIVIALSFIGAALIRAAKETCISGSMQDTDDRPLAGVILIEKGRLYGKDYQYGGLVDEQGRFSVKVPEGGSYGLHLYATGYIYHPVGVAVKAGEDNRFTFTLPPNSAVKDAPKISEARFEPAADNPNRVTIRLTVSDPNQNLSHQVLGANIKTQEGFIFAPPSFVFPWTQDYPNGVYTLHYDTRERPFNQKEWIFVAADNRCYNSPVLGHPFTQEGVTPAISTAVSGPPSESAAVSMPLMDLGKKTFADNCAVCHYADKEEAKVGPGLKGLFKKKLTPTHKHPVTEEHIRAQIQQGSEKMPPYAHITGRALEGLLEYLKSL